MMTRLALLVGILVGIAPATAQEAERSVDRGRYLVTITGCNDCHTEGYAEAKGDIPEIEWLKGSSLGYRGPWGTSYAVNLRITAHYANDEGWLQSARRSSSWPPMPSYNLQKMSDADLLSILDFIKSLGRAGTKTPNVVYPGKEPGGQYISFPGAL